jgi:carotenoid 1,2-hydratase
VSAGKARPTDHVALNVALYGGPRRWAMTERGEAALARSADTLAIGPSDIRWTGDRLDIRVDERGAVFGERLLGRIRLWPEALARDRFPLDADGRHWWAPVAPRARIEVVLDRPALAWTGDAYFDSNGGAEPMEARFRHWQWSRAHGRDGTRIFYEGERLDGGRFGLALVLGPDGTARHAATPPLSPLRPTAWLMPRSTRSEGPARVLRTWEDAPFYARSVLETRMDGETVVAVHESLSLTRFRSPLVQRMLPYRMPRQA